MKKIIALLALLLAIAGGIFWYKSANSDKKPNFMTVDVTHGDIIEQVLATGSISGIKEVNVGAQVSGQVQKLYVDYGDQVKKGQLLAIIDPRLQENDLKTAKASYESVKANIRSRIYSSSASKRNWSVRNASDRRMQAQSLIMMMRSQQCSRLPRTSTR